mmetsp:Transcript_105461/g.235465  ORF Transcript_105461/g.235465 Transcript_105461/m.235465 type:complete len:83 (+) Transcript_105461:123-371(+)
MVFASQFDGFQQDPSACDFPEATFGFVMVFQRLLEADNAWAVRWGMPRKGKPNETVQNDLMMTMMCMVCAMVRSAVHHGCER